jgi:hypothetical protein
MTTDTSQFRQYFRFYSGQNLFGQIRTLGLRNSARNASFVLDSWLEADLSIAVGRVHSCPFVVAEIPRFSVLSLLAGLLEDRLNRRSAFFENFVPWFP